MLGEFFLSGEFVPLLHLWSNHLALTDCPTGGQVEKTQGLESLCNVRGQSPYIILEVRVPIWYQGLESSCDTIPRWAEDPITIMLQEAEGPIIYLWIHTPIHTMIAYGCNSWSCGSSGGIQAQTLGPQIHVQLTLDLMIWRTGSHDVSVGVLVVICQLYCAQVYLPSLWELGWHTTIVTRALHPHAVLCLSWGQLFYRSAQYQSVGIV